MKEWAHSGEACLQVDVLTCLNIFSLSSLAPVLPLGNIIVVSRVRRGRLAALIIKLTGQ